MIILMTKGYADAAGLNLCDGQYYEIDSQVADRLRRAGCCVEVTQVPFGKKLEQVSHSVEVVRVEAGVSSVRLSTPELEEAKSPTTFVSLADFENAKPLEDLIVNEPHRDAPNEDEIGILSGLTVQEPVIETEDERPSGFELDTMPDRDEPEPEPEPQPEHHDKPKTKAKKTRKG